MSPLPKTFSELIDLWKSLADFAADHGVTLARARMWRRRNSIPAGWWTTTVAAAQKRDIPGITADLMADLAARGGRDDANSEAA